jgi:hypothetical protein
VLEKVGGNVAGQKFLSPKRFIRAPFQAPHKRKFHKLLSIAYSLCFNLYFFLTAFVPTAIDSAISIAAAYQQDVP